jgi:hypothetical protein
MNSGNDYTEESRHHVDMRTFPLVAGSSPGSGPLGMDLKTLTHYIGCKVINKQSSYKSFSIYTLESVSPDGVAMLRSNRYKNLTEVFDHHKNRLILRPFSVITDEEVKILGISGYKEQYVKAVFQKTAVWTPEQLKYIGLRRLDVFGLIDKGIAAWFGC